MARRNVRTQRQGTPSALQDQLDNLAEQVANATQAMDSLRQQVAGLTRRADDAENESRTRQTRLERAETRIRDLEGAGAPSSETVVASGSSTDAPVTIANSASSVKDDSSASATASTDRKETSTNTEDPSAAPKRKSERNVQRETETIRLRRRYANPPTPYHGYVSKLPPPDRPTPDRTLRQSNAFCLIPPVLRRVANRCANAPSPSPTSSLKRLRDEDGDGQPAISLLEATPKYLPSRTLSLTSSSESVFGSVCLESADVVSQILDNGDVNDSASESSSGTRKKRRVSPSPKLECDKERKGDKQRRRN